MIVVQEESVNVLSN